MNDRLNMIVVPTEAIWKWQHYGNNFIALFPRFLALVEDVFLIYLLTIQRQVVEIRVTFNDMSLEQSVLNLPLTMSAHQEATKWISLDWWSLGKRVIKWGSFNKTDFFSENNLSEGNK